MSATIQLDGVITKYMGETAAKLRLVFDAIQSTRGVYLFDEFDAIGGRRTSTNDVGEIRRVLNSFLGFLEMDDSESLIIGATNHASLLDRALFRRFDAVLEYGLPYRGVIGVYPVSGWWKDQPKRDRSDRGTRYSLIVSIDTQATDIDLWTPVATEVGLPIATEIEV